MMSVMMSWLTPMTQRHDDVLLGRNDGRILLWQCGNGRWQSERRGRKDRLQAASLNEDVYDDDGGDLGVDDLFE